MVIGGMVTGGNITGMGPKEMVAGAALNNVRDSRVSRRGTCLRTVAWRRR